MSSSRLPARPSLEQLRKQAKDFLQRVRAGDPATLQRLHAVIPNRQPANEPILADAQFVIAREYGFDNWAALASHVEAVSGSWSLGPLIRPVEMQDDDVYAMFVAA